MNLDIQLFWSAVYFLGLFLLWLSFYLLSEPVKNLERSSGKATHWKYILLALAFLVVKPVVDGYYTYVAGNPPDDLINFASVLAILMGSIFVFVPIANLSKRSLSDSIGNSTWLFYLQMAIIGFYFATQTPNVFGAVSSAVYLIAALILGMSLRLMSNFAEQFEIMFPLRWMFDSAAWLLPLALAIRAYGVSVATRFADAVTTAYVYGELRTIFIFLIFISGLVSFIAAFTLKKSVLTSTAK